VSTDQKPAREQARQVAADVAAITVRWAAWSPLRAYIAAMVVLAVLAAGGLALRASGIGHPGHKTAARPAAGGQVVPLTTTDTPTVGAAPAPRVTIPAGVDAAAVTGAYLFTRAWATHPDGVKAATWRSGLAPYATPELLANLAQSDPSRVPATTADSPTTARKRPDGMVDVDVPTDAGPFTVTMQSVAGRWLAYDIESA
jgi:hypothetical protein